MRQACCDVQRTDWRSTRPPHTMNHQIRAALRRAKNGLAIDTRAEVRALRRGQAVATCKERIGDRHRDRPAVPSSLKVELRRAKNGLAIDTGSS